MLRNVQPHCLLISYCLEANRKIADQPGDPLGFTVWPDSVSQGWIRKKPRAEAGDSQYQLLQIALNDHVLHRAHRNFEQVRIRSIREMSVDLFLGISV